MLLPLECRGRAVTELHDRLGRVNEDEVLEAVPIEVGRCIGYTGHPQVRLAGLGLEVRLGVDAGEAGIPSQDRRSARPSALRSAATGWA